MSPVVERQAGGNLHRKVIALFLAVTLYSFVVLEKATARTFTLATRPGDVPAGMVMLGELPDVRLTLSGHHRTFAQLRPEDMQFLTLGALQPGQTVYRVTEADFVLPEGLEVVDISPSILPLRLEELRTSRLPVHVNTRGEPAPGFEVSRRSVTPDTVSVSAPASYFPELDSIFTETIDLSDLRESTARDVSLALPRPYMTVEGDPLVTVLVDVVAISTTHEVGPVPVVLLGAEDPRFEVSPEPGAISATLRGPTSAMSRLDPGSLFARADLAGVVTGETGLFAAPVRIENLPAGLSVVELRPQTVRVRVTRREESAIDGSGQASPDSP